MSYIFFFKQKTAYEMRISDWSSDVCSSDLRVLLPVGDVCGPTSCRRAERQYVMSTESVKIANKLEYRPAVRSADPTAGARRTRPEIGRASCRERVCQYV